MVWLRPTGTSAYAGIYAESRLFPPPDAFSIGGREAIGRSHAERPYTIRPTGITVDELIFLSPAQVSNRSIPKGQRLLKTGGAGVPLRPVYVDLSIVPGGEVGGYLPHVERQFPGGSAASRP